MSRPRGPRRIDLTAISRWSGRPAGLERPPTPMAAVIAFAILLWVGIGVAAMLACLGGGWIIACCLKWVLG